MPNGGATAIRGFNFQFAASALQVARLISEPGDPEVVFEGPSDSADFSVNPGGGKPLRSYQFKSRTGGSWKPAEVKSIINDWLDRRQYGTDSLMIQLQGLPGPSLSDHLIPRELPNSYTPKVGFVSRSLDFDEIFIVFGMPDTNDLMDSVAQALHQIRVNPALYLDVRDQCRNLVTIISQYSELPALANRTVSINKLALKIGIIRNAALGIANPSNFNHISPLRQSLIEQAVAFVASPLESLKEASHSTLILHGPSGIGKTHLRREIVLRLQNLSLRVVEVESLSEASTAIWHIKRVSNYIGPWPSERGLP